MRHFFFLGLSTLFLVSCVQSTNTSNTATPQETASTFYHQPTSQLTDENREEKSSTKSVQQDDRQQKGDVIFTHSTRKGKLYHHEHYSFSYSEEDEQSEWVGYELTKEETRGNSQRKDSFKEDPIVVTESSHTYEYRESGYTKGHLAPAGDMKFNKTAMEECFYTSNISPQTKKFNAGIWNELEMQTRFWAQKFGTIYVVTGPVLTEKNLSKMTFINNRGFEEKSDITIPDKFYKIIYDFSYEGKEKMIGFLISQEDKGDIFDYAVSVDEIEELTGIDFFHNLSKAEQEKLEGNLDLPAWKKFTYENKYKQ